MFLIERVSNKISSRISNALDLDEDHKEIIAYGAFSILQITWSIFWVIIFGAIFKVLIQAIIILFIVSLLRKYSGGVHASSPNRCIVIGTFACVGLAIISNNLKPQYSQLWVVMLYILSLIYSYYIIYKFAPVDSPSKRISTEEARQYFKKCSLIVLSILFTSVAVLILLYLKFEINYLLPIIQCICFGVLWQITTLTNFGHNILTKVDYILEKVTTGRK
ncbi:MAG: accessory gene regulator B family protein [Bacillota bacterium]|nr:accessory gene regulator B family protein [Bacillota bacterium]